MKKITSTLVLATFFLFGGPADKSTSTKSCTPSYRDVENEIRVRFGDFELSFRVLAIGCNEELEKTWPLEHNLVEREFRLGLQNDFPIQATATIRNQSPRLRERLTKRINRLIGLPAVTDVYFYDVKLESSDSGRANQGSGLRHSYD